MKEKQILMRAFGKFFFLALLYIGVQTLAYGQLVVTPASYTFPDTKVGILQLQTFTIANNGTQQVVINGVTVQGTNPNDFLAGTGCPQFLLPGQLCAVNVQFRPLALGSRSAVVVINTDQPSNPAVNVSGTGLDPVVTITPSSLVGSPSPLVFPFTKLGQTSNRTITLTNTSASTFRIDNTQLGGLSSGEFSLTSECQDTALISNGTCVLSLAFLPNSPGVRSGLVVVTAEGPDKVVRPYLEIAISGESGTTGASSLVATPTSLTFGQIKLNKTATLTLNLQNSLTITGNSFSSLSLTSEDFTQTNDCNLVIEAAPPKSKIESQSKSPQATLGSGRKPEATASGCTITVTFKPSVLGTRTAELNVADNFGNTLAVPISGGGVGGLTDAQIRQIATQQITANLQSMQLGLQSQLSNVNKRLRYLRFQDSIPAFRQEIDLTLNGKGLPLPSGGGGACGSAGGREGATASNREECEEDARRTRNGRWGTYLTGGVAVSENTLNSAKINSNGITIGTDYRLSGKSAVGAAFGAMKSKTDMSLDAGKQDATGYSFVAYGSFAPSQASYIDIALTAGNGKFDLQRTEAAGGTAVADTTGTGLGLSLTAGLDWRDGSWAVTPYGRAEYVNSKVKAFTERGTDPIAVGDQSMTSSLFSLGVELQYTASTIWGIFIPHARIEYQNQSQSSADSTAQAVGSTVQLTVTPDLNKDKSFGNVGIGASAQFGKGKTGFLDFERSFGRENIKEQRFTAGYKVEF